MPRELVLQFGGKDLAFAPQKVDRTRLYGFTEVEALDDAGRTCQLVTLAEDGRTLVGTGGTSFATLSQDGEWLERTEIKAVDAEGKEIVPVASSYEKPVALAKKATIEEYLDHNIKGVYLMPCASDLGDLKKELSQGAIFTFPYSFRGGLEADVGFLLTNPEGELFLVVGQPTSIHFVGMEQASPLTEEVAEDAAEEEDGLDFGMM